MLYFLTGNVNKFNEAKTILPEIEQLNIDLPEIQEIDPHKIIREKLITASAHHDGAFVVEDTSLEMECLGGLPGPLIKWFEKTIGIEGLAKLAIQANKIKATARVTLGYKSSDKISYYEGSLDGTIVKPRGDLDFGWGPIFQPEGHDKTFGGMPREEKNAMSMRRIAFQKLKEHLENMATG
jgi:non-canonical purine NTP pyrophosphatase (RdgB/HAM1 family)